MPDRARDVENRALTQKRAEETAMKLRRWTSAVVVAMAVAAGCSDDGGGSRTAAERDALVEAFVANGTDASDAECWADELEKYTAEDFNAFVAATSAADIDPGFAKAVTDAGETCTP